MEKRDRGAKTPARNCSVTIDFPRTMFTRYVLAYSVGCVVVGVQGASSTLTTPEGNFLFERSRSYAITTSEAVCFSASTRTRGDDTTTPLPREIDRLTPKHNSRYYYRGRSIDSLRSTAVVVGEAELRSEAGAPSPATLAATYGAARAVGALETGEAVVTRGGCCARRRARDICKELNVTSAYSSGCTGFLTAAVPNVSAHKLHSGNPWRRPMFGLISPSFIPHYK